MSDKKVCDEYLKNARMIRLIGATTELSIMYPLHNPMTHKKLLPILSNGGRNSTKRAVMTVAKTQNAFAFRDFDKRKILQRPIFKHVEINGEHFLEGNRFIDDEVINSLRATDDVNKNETNLKKLQAIYEKLVYYQVRLIDRIHLPRLVRLKRATKNPELRKRAENLREEYDDDATQVTMTSAWVKKEIEKLEKIIQEQNRNIFASRLKQARQEKKISQRDLSELTKINRADIGLYETGKKFPSLDNFIKIVRCMGFSADWLLGMERIS